MPVKGIMPQVGTPLLRSGLVEEHDHFTDKVSILIVAYSCHRPNCLAVWPIRNGRLLRDEKAPAIFVLNPHLKRARRITDGTRRLVLGSAPWFAMRALAEGLSLSITLPTRWSRRGPLSKPQTVAIQKIPTRTQCPVRARIALHL